MVVRVDHKIGDGRLFVDDGSCVTELMLRPEDAKGQPWRPGSPKSPSFFLPSPFLRCECDDVSDDQLCLCRNIAAVA